MGMSGARSEHFCPRFFQVRVELDLLLTPIGSLDEAFVGPGWIEWVPGVMLYGGVSDVIGGSIWGLFSFYLIICLYILVVFNLYIHKHIHTDN